MKELWWDGENESLHFILDAAEKKKFKASEKSIIAGKADLPALIAYVIETADNMGIENDFGDTSDPFSGFQIMMYETETGVEFEISKAEPDDLEEYLESTGVDPDEIMEALQDYLDGYNEAAEEIKPWEEKDDYLQVVYNNLDDVINDPFLNDIKGVKSTLIRMNERYYLTVLSKGFTKKHNYHTEIGESDTVTKSKHEYLKEHGKIFNISPAELLRLKEKI